MMKRLHAKMVLIMSFLCAVLLTSAIPAAATAAVKPVQVYVQDKEIHPAAAPIISGGRVYVEFRSVVQALGFAIKYDTAKKIITATSEDTTFKIDLKTRATYVNDVLFIYDNNPSMIIDSRGNLMVMMQIFQRTNYLYADYIASKRTVYINDNPMGKPKKSEMRIIQSVILKHYQSKNASATIKNFALQSWGTYVTVSVDANVPKSGEELLDHLEHATFEMERGDKGSWTIHNIQAAIEYVNYKSLSQMTAVVSDADKIAINELIQTYYKALNEENAKALVALLDPDALPGGGKWSIADLENIYTDTFHSEAIEFGIEQTTIVSYSPDKAIVYVIGTMRDRDSSQQPDYRTYTLNYLDKALNGKWYVNRVLETLLGIEKIEK